MTQPTTLPSAQAQQQAAVEVFAQYEPPLYEAYLDMMLEWLAAVKTAMFTGGIVKLGLVPDPFTVFSQGPKWQALTDKYTEQVAREVLAAPYKDLFADGTLFESRPFVRNWIATRANRLQQVPDEVFGAVKHIVDAATVNGASIPDVQEQVEELFGDTGVAKWKNRARTVARTEVVGAYNGGLHDAFSMVVGADPDTAYVKRWLATEDQRTRPDHREADGQAVPWGQPFIVGGFAMMHPHDPAAPAKEVVNCRCVELLEHAGEPTSMENRGYKNSLTAGFNPLEKRDKDGKWSKGGGLLKSLIKKGEKGKSDLSGIGPAPWVHETPQAAPAPLVHEMPKAPSVPSAPRAERLGDTVKKSSRGEADSSKAKIIGLPEDWRHENPDQRYDEAANGADALKQFKTIDSMPEPERNGLAYYAGEGFENLNFGLARSAKLGEDPHKFLDSTDLKTLKLLDSATAPTQRAKDVIVWRGMRNGPAKFGDAWNGDLAGAEWTQSGYSSTSADFGIAAGFATRGQHGIILRVLVPKEAKVGGVDMRGKANFNSHEAEVMFGRGIRYRVTADHGMSKGGLRTLDVEVVQ